MSFFFSLIFLTVIIVAFVRNTLVFSIRRTALDEIHNNNLQDIRSGATASMIAATGDNPPASFEQFYEDLTKNSKRRYERFDSHSYFGMLFDVFKWKYSHFYAEDEFK